MHATAWKPNFYFLLFILTGLLTSATDRVARAQDDSQSGSAVIYSEAEGMPEVFDFTAQQDERGALSGDFNHDGSIDRSDYHVWRDNYGSTLDLSADANGDGVVDGADYTVWRDHFSVMPESPAAQQPHLLKHDEPPGRKAKPVPEPPATILVGGLVALILVIFFLRRYFDGQATA